MAEVWFARWKSGPARDFGLSGDPVVVSITEFAPHRPWTMIGVCREGAALRRTWPDIDGAIGMWLWVAPGLLRPRSGSVSVWRDEADLRRFVGRRDHVRIMRAYRDRGTLRSMTWRAESFEKQAVHEETRALISGHALWASPS